MGACWLMKSEPSVFSIADLAASPEQRTSWDGVRNYQARNIMRDQMQPGDRVLFYHSGKKPGVVGAARVVCRAYPDHSAWDSTSPYYDTKADPEKPVWYMVDIQLEQIFPRPVLLSELREVEGLENMLLLKRGMRLSVQPVTAGEFDIIVALGQTAQDAAAT